MNMADTAPAQADRVVLTATRAATLPYSVELINKVEPGLNPYHPNHRQKVPRNWSATEWGGNSWGSSNKLPSSS